MKNDWEESRSKGNSMREGHQRIEQFEIDNSYDQQRAAQGASVYNATLNICKSGFGTTILFMPYVFMKCGFILAIILMSFTGLLCYYAWMELIRVIQRIEQQENHVRQVTLNIAAEVILGKNMMILSEIFTIMFNFGTILSYMVFIQKSMVDILETKLTLFLIMGAIFIPFSLYKNIEKLGIFSQFGLASFFAAVFVIIGKSLYLLFTGGNTSINKDYQLNLFSFNEIPLFFGVYVFAYDINGVITDVYASMQEKNKFDLILKRYIVVMCLTGLITGSIGYSAFQDQTSDLIFSNLIDMGVLQKILKIFYSVSLLGSILLYGFPILQRADLFTERKYLNITEVGRTLIRLFFFLLIFMLATQLPRLTDLFNLLGCFFSIGLGFVFPILLAEKIAEDEKDTKRRIMNYLVLFIGLIGGASGVVSTILEIF